MELDHIYVKGAREHNLDIDELEIPKKKLVVLTGVSGSGKSSLAFDTLYAEGQRRYVESLSSYARQFLGQMDKPHYDQLRGLSPTIAIDQKAASGNPRSTVGTITEIYDYLRVLYARVGVQHCPKCERVVESLSTDQVVARIQQRDRQVLLLAPLVVHRKGEYRELMAEKQRRGFARARIDGQLCRLEDPPELDKRRKHTIELVIDRVDPGSVSRSRLTDSVEMALAEGDGVIHVLAADASADEAPLRLSQHRHCTSCDISLPELSPQSFSFNSPLGMCETCNGLGKTLEMDPDLVVPDPSLSIRAGAIHPWASLLERGSGWNYSIFMALEEHFSVDLDRPWQDLEPDHRQLIMFGTDQRVRVKWKGRHGGGSWNTRFEGVLNTLMRRYRETKSESMRQFYQRYFSNQDCTQCEGRRLRPESLAVRVAGKNVDHVVQLPVGEARAHFRQLELSGTDALIAAELLKEINSRLDFLGSVGLEYLTLSRLGPSLSGGEAQRIRLASQLGSELSGVMYVLDEPSIGLHQRDNLRLIETLKRLRDVGNSVIVVEHDQETIEAADHVVDFGPGAGRLGGKVVFSGTPDQLKKADCLTGRYIGGRTRIEIPQTRRAASGELAIIGASENNLRHVTARFPLGTLTAVTGVSGAGKSSLVTGILYPALHRKLHGGTKATVGRHERIEGLEQIDKVIHIDQSPIGRTPRSNPATYTKLFDEIRTIFAMTPDARARGYKPGRFSFNVRGGRCETCEGDGVKRVEMHFLSDVYVPCEVCNGKRYNEATLQVRYKGRNISDVLDTSVAEAIELFAAIPKTVRILQTLADVGLDYVHLGQPAPTLSGGEAQRVKLSRELAKRSTGKTLYVLDEPTTGLHFDDIRKLLQVLDRLVDVGNTVVVIEHNLDVIKCADHVIDLGPEGGSGGGEIVCVGTPEQVVENERSSTGHFLAEVLAGSVGEARSANAQKAKPRARGAKKQATAKKKSAKAAPATKKTPGKKARRAAS